MLQRSLASAVGLPWASAAALSSSCCCNSLGNQQQTTSSSTTTSSSSSSSTTAGAPWMLQFQRLFRTGVWKVKHQPRRQNEPYFNPDDGPDAYFYWRDLWRNPAPQPKPRKPSRPPVYLEPEQEAALLSVALDRGVPRDLLYGHDGRRVPRFIAALTASGGRIPTDVSMLGDRISGLYELQRNVPGLDINRIFKAFGFDILSQSTQAVKRQLTFLSRRLPASGVDAEPGLVFTAAPKPAMKYAGSVVTRAQELPGLFQECLGVSAPPAMLSHPFNATLLNRSSKTTQKHMEALAESHGQAAAAAIATKLPQLLHYQPSTLEYKTLVVAQGLGLSKAAVQQLVQKQPKLLTHSAEVLQQRLMDLKELLQLSDQGLRHVVQKQASLLHKKRETLEGKISHLKELLGISHKQTLTLLKQKPSLLSYSTAALSRPVAQLKSLEETSVLGPAVSKVSELFLSRPRLLTLTAEPDSLSGSSKAAPQASLRSSLRSRLALLEDLAASGPAWQSKVSGLVAGGEVKELARVLAHAKFCSRLLWVLQQQQQQQQMATSSSGSSSSSSSSSAAEGLLDLLEMPVTSFEQQYEGYSAWQQQQSGAKKLPQQ